MSKKKIKKIWGIHEIATSGSRLKVHRSKLKAQRAHSPGVAFSYAAAGPSFHPSHWNASSVAEATQDRPVFALASFPLRKSFGGQVGEHVGGQALWLVVPKLCKHRRTNFRLSILRSPAEAGRKDRRQDYEKIGTGLIYCVSWVDCRILIRHPG